MSKDKSNLDHSGTQEMEIDKQKLKTLVIEDVKYRTYYNKKFENRKIWKAPDSRFYISFIPGTILKVTVRPNQKIKKGTDLLVMDSMKMANTIKSHSEGLIRKVYVKEGDKIPKGFIMLEFE
jgi:biotin carboxyl carrier protein